MSTGALGMMMRFIFSFPNMCRSGLEGVFGDAPFGNKGLVVWNCMRHRIWENEKYGIMDCYAINVDEQENLWFYYYADDDLVRTDFEKDISYHPEIEGMTKFLITKGK